jgi:broad specificity phosphatase PhoE
MLRANGDFPVYFARHGETVFNIERRWQGSGNDSPLTARGREQAEKIATILGDLISLSHPPLFIASPLGRARVTMEIILETLRLPLEHTVDKRLVEMDLGEWTGLLDSEVIANDKRRWDEREMDKWNVPIPGGESYAMIAERVEDWFLSLTEECVVVSHGGFGRILRGLYGGLSWQEISALDEPQDCVFRFQMGTIACFRGE